MTGSEAEVRAVARLDAFAAELVDMGLVEFIDFYMPHRAGPSSPLPASEIHGIRYDEDAGGFRIYFRDTGVTKVVMENGSWEDARALYLLKVTESSPFGRRTP